MFEEALRQKPRDGASLFVDMNSFFASCEQQRDRSLRDRPIGVCPFISDATCVIAASIEAKRFGVKTAMRVTDAKRLCPQIQLVEADPRLYRHFHRLIVQELENLPCRITVKSIDEALLQVPSYLRQEVLGLAEDLKGRISQIGERLRCSVGIGPNMFLAKMASNLMKPDGLVEVRLDQLENFYSRLSLTDLHGISWRMEQRLKDMGIQNPLAFYRTPYPLLRQRLGVNGQAWYLRLRGYEVDLRPTQRQSIGHQLTIVPHPAKDRREVLAVASQLTYRAAIRLRSAELQAKGIVVLLRFNDRTWWKRVYHGRFPFSDSRGFFAQVEHMIPARLPKPVRLVSVSAIDLIPISASTPSLFDPSPRNDSLSRALDEINFRFGESTVATGRQFLVDNARDAIGFGNAAHNAQELPR